MRASSVIVLAAGETKEHVDAVALEADDQLAVDRQDGCREDIAALQEVGGILIGHHVMHPERYTCGPQVVLETLAWPSERRGVEDDLAGYHAVPMPLSSL